MKSHSIVESSHHSPIERRGKARFQIPQGFQLVLPPLPENFPEPIPQVGDIAQRLSEPMAPEPGTVDVGWNTDDNVQLCDYRDYNVRVPRLFDQGALFIMGPDTPPTQSGPSLMPRYVLGARFSLTGGGASTIYRAALKLLGLAYPKKAVLLLPDTPGMKAATYGPQLANDISKLLNGPAPPGTSTQANSCKVGLFHYPYQEISPDQTWSIQQSYTVSLNDYSTHKDIVWTPWANVPVESFEESPRFYEPLAASQFANTTLPEADIPVPIPPFPDPRADLPLDKDVPWIYEIEEEESHQGERNREEEVPRIDDVVLEDSPFELEDSPFELEALPLNEDFGDLSINDEQHGQYYNKTQ